jgi:hypothetical protein
MYNGKVIPSAYALTISPYKDFWFKDTDPDKAEAINMFSYAYFLLNPKKTNIFYSYDPKIRGSKIKERIWGKSDYNSPLFSALEIMGLVNQYREDLLTWSPSIATLDDALITATKTREYLRDVDLAEENLNGTLKLKPKDVTGALKEIPEIIKTLETTRDNVIAELKESAKSRNNREIGFFER